MKLGKEGAVPLDDTYVQHFDACLGCMACVTACPSGVKYDELIEAVRPQLERNYRRSLADRLFRGMIFQLFPYPTRLRAAAVGGALYQRVGGRYLLERSGLRKRLPARLQAVEELMPPARLRGLTRRLPAFIPAQDTARRRRVAMLEGCVQRVFFRDVNEATARVLAREGCDVIVPRAQRCCGALSEHAGREPEALERARRLIDVFEGADVDAIVVNVAGCGSTMKEYGRLLRDDPSVRRTGGGVLGEGARHLGGARRPGARRAAAPHRGPGRLPRRLPSRARPARPAPAAGGAAHHPGPGGDRHPGGRHLLRFGRHLQHGAARRRCRTGPAQDRQRHVGGAGRGGHGQSRMPPADSAGTCPGPCRCSTPFSSSTRRSGESTPSGPASGAPLQAMTRGRRNRAGYDP